MRRCRPKEGKKEKGRERGVCSLRCRAPAFETTAVTPKRRKKKGRNKGKDKGEKSGALAESKRDDPLTLEPGSEKGRGKEGKGEENQKTYDAKA